MRNPSEDFKKGQEIFRTTQNYKDCKNLEQHNGFICEERISRNGYQGKVWNLPANYKTSADVRTLFI